MKIVLIRRDTNEDGTDGSLTLPSGKVIQTLELPWRNNQDDKSCIPYGSYDCKRVNSPKFGKVFEVMSVPQRENVLIHKGNFLDNTHGCILLGMTRARKGDQDAIGNSKTAFDLFMSEMTCEEFTLEIR